jgi:hypothetical protein
MNKFSAGDSSCQILQLVKFCSSQLMSGRRRRSSPGCSSQAMQLVARLCMDRGDPPARSVRPVVRRCLRSGSLGSGTMRQFTICSHKNIDLFTNLRPGSDARALVNMHKKGVITHSLNHKSIQDKIDSSHSFRNPLLCLRTVVRY